MQGRDLLGAAWEEQFTIHEGVEAGVAGANADERSTLRAARGFGAKLTLQTKLGPGLAAVPLSDDALGRLKDLGYVGGSVGKGGFFDLNADPRELKDLSLDATLDPRHASQVKELLRVLESAPAEPESGK
jgi:hypothetical protein